MPRPQATTDRVVATIVGCSEPTLRDTPGSVRSVRIESVGKEKERAPVASTVGTLAQTLREVARWRRPTETVGWEERLLARAREARGG